MLNNMLDCVQSQKITLNHTPLNIHWSPVGWMIAFITTKSSLVPLIEGLCAQIYFRFEISVVCSHLLLFFFVKEKNRGSGNLLSCLSPNPRFSAGLGPIHRSSGLIGL